MELKPIKISSLKNMRSENDFENKHFNSLRQLLPPDPNRYLIVDGTLLHNNKMAERVDESLRAIKLKVHKKNDEINEAIENSKRIKEDSRSLKPIDFSIFDKMKLAIVGNKNQVSMPQVENLIQIYEKNYNFS